MPALSAVVGRVVALVRGVPAAPSATLLVVLSLAGPGGWENAGAAPARAIAIQDDGGDDEEQDDAEGADDAAADDAEDALTDAEIDVAALNVRIDAGECAAPAEHTAAFPLPAATAVGSGDDDEAFASESEVPVPIGDLVASPHVLVIDLDDAGLTVPIACANVTGTPDGGALIIGLEAAETGDLTGIVILREGESGGATSVATYVVLSADSEPDAGTEGTDDEGEDSGDGESGV